MNKRFCSVVSVVLLVIVLLSAFVLGCAKPTPAPTVASTASPTTKPAERLELTMIDWMGTSHWAVPGQYAFLERVEKLSGGRLKTKAVLSTAAGLKFTDILPTLKEGTTQMHNGGGFYLSGQNRVFGIPGVPFLLEDRVDFGGVLPVVRTSWQAELDKWNALLLMFYPIDDQLIGANKLLSGASDFKGLRFRTTGNEMAKLISQLGGVPVTLALSDVYMSAEKGLLGGLASMGANSWVDYGFNKFFKYIMDFRTNSLDNYLIMNKKHFDSLPADIKVIILEEAARTERELWQKSIEVNARGRRLLAEQGNSIIVPPESLKTEMRRLAEPITDGWAAGDAGLIETLKSIRGILKK